MSNKKTEQTAYEWFITKYKAQGYKSLNAFANAEGFQKSSLSRYFNGERELPAATLVSLAVALKTTPQAILKAFGYEW